MFVFRNTFTDRKGRTKETTKWYVDFTNAAGTRCRLPGFTDHKASEALGRMIERLVACRASGESLPLDVQRWLQALPDAIRAALHKFGLLDGTCIAAGRTLKNHLADWQTFLIAKGNTPRYTSVKCARATAIIDGCKFTCLSDLNASKVMGFLGDLHTDGLAAGTFNDYLSAIKAFARWLCRDGRATSNPLEYLTPLNARLDRRHDRRALGVVEIHWLLDTAAKGRTVRGLTGPTRALLYRLALESGLRAAELASLTRESFRLDADPPTVTVAAGYSKHRREDTLPLRPDTAAKLRDLIATILPGVPIFIMPRHRPMSETLAEDLAAARAAWLADAKTPDERKSREERTDFLAYLDAAGRYADFHSLRHTCGSLLAAAGVHPKTAQSILRHSDINLTMARYSHVYNGQEAAAIAKLPDFGKTNSKKKQREATA